MLNNRYRIADTLHENLSTLVYRGNRASDGKAVIIKMLKPGEITEYRVFQFANERRILSMLRFPGIPDLLDVSYSPSEYCHVFEDIGGTSLYDLLLTRRFSLAEGLEIALKIAEGLRYLHQKHIIHADINPKNVVYNPDTHALQIIDFGFSIIDNHFRYNSERNVGTSGNLMYMSPEQTGKTKQKIDRRSDFYSLGMTLYHLFSGEAPFKAKDRFELIHQQIARTPRRLDEQIPGFSPVVTEIVGRLIEKKGEKRYQSDEAIVFDLKQALRNLDASGAVAAFEIGTQDRPGIEIGERLFGRSREIAQLTEMASCMGTEVPLRLIVSGRSGVGKSRLIEEFLVSLNSVENRILRGKFDEYKSAHSYLTLRQMFAQLATASLRRRGGTGTIRVEESSARVLGRFFPELRPLLDIPRGRWEGDELHHHLPYAVQELFRQIATAESPLVLFFDDLQWADGASVELIDKAIVQATCPHLHLIIGYRDNEIVSDSQVGRLLNKLRGHARIPARAIELTSLRTEDLEEMTAALLGERSSAVSQLASLVHKKTLGNPFYVKTFLEGLIDAEVLLYREGRWKFEIDRVRLYGSGGDIEELIGSRYNQLPEEEKGCLDCLALLGGRFKLSLVFEVFDSLQLSRQGSERLQEKGFIECSGEEYVFVHDIVRHFIVDGMESEKRIRLHARIGEVLKTAYEGGRYDDLVGVVSHMNVRCGTGDKRLCRLNLQALEQMLRSGGYEAALSHLRMMERNGVEKGLGTARSARFLYGRIKAKILYLNALHEEADAAIAALIPLARNEAEKRICFSLYKDLCITRGSGFEALLAYANVVIGEMGVRPPVSSEETAAEVKRLECFVDTHPLSERPEAISKLPRSTRKSQEGVIAMLIDYWEAAYYLADIALMEWAYMTIIEKSFRFGNTAGSPFGYVLYGAQLVSQHRFRNGYRFGEAAVKLNRRLPDAAMLPKIHNFMANFISPYVRGWDDSRALYRTSLHQSTINGDIVFGTWANYLMHLSGFFSGKSLDTLRSEMERESAFLLNSGDRKMIAAFHLLMDIVRGLQGPYDPVGEEPAVAMWEEERFYPALAWYGILKAQICWIDGEIVRGLEYLERFVRTTASEVIMFAKLRLHPLRALLLLSKPTPLEPSEVETLRIDLDECDAYAQASPARFRFWKLLLRAERAKGVDEHWDVAKYYDEALREGQRSKTPFYAAMAGMCAGRYWKGLKFDDLSRFYFSEATVGLNQWGAYEAAQHLHRPLSAAPHPVEEKGEASSSSSLLKSEPVNFRSLLKTFYSLSQVMDKKRLLQSLMQIILENASASKAVLVLEEEGGYRTVAGIHFGSGELELMNLALPEAPFLPFNLIVHAISTGRRVAVNDPAHSGKFQYDDYFQSHSPASCTAIPASVEGRVRGILYLENEEIATPLDGDAVQTLRLLLAQTAIVYRKIVLYETLKRSEENLNKAQQLSHVGSWQYDNATGRVTWSAETYRIYERDPREGAPEEEWMMSNVHAEDVPKVMRAKEAVSGGAPFTEVINRIITGRGNVRVVRQRVETYWENDYQKLFGTVQDITESKQAEEIIDRLSQVVNQTPFSTIITDRNGVIGYANNAALELSGYFRDELIGQRMSLFSSGCHPKEFYADLWETITRKRSIWRSTIVNRMKDGTLRDCASTIFPVFDIENTIVSFVTIQDDVTERNMKDKLFLMQTRQAQMGEMLSMIAHQWRQPLAIVSALMNRQKINILLEQATFEEISHSFDEIETQVQHLSRTITDFKDFFRPDKERVMTRNSAIVAKTLDLIEHSLMTRNIRVETLHGGDDEYRTYENELVQVLLNLLTNAQDAFAERSVPSPRLVIRTDTEGGEGLISVEDNAGGIPVEILDTLFAPYVSTKTGDHGTGLGLYMGKLIVEEHCHGTIRVENTDEGARFTLRFPLRLS